MIRRKLPRLLAMVAAQWSNLFVPVWQRVNGKWVKSHSFRGGWQGSRLTMLVFCLTITEAMSEVPMIASGKVATVGIMDDWYLAGNARDIAVGWPALEQALAKGVTSYRHVNLRSGRQHWTNIKRH